MQFKHAKKVSLFFQLKGSTISIGTTYVDGETALTNEVEVE
jgi:hypothetical protein